MWARRYALGQLWQVPVRVHLSLLILLGASALQTQDFKIGVLLFALLLVGVFLHEAAHARVGKLLGYSINSISLHAFGGAKALDSPPDTVRDDILVSLAGPAASLLAGGVFAVLGYYLPLVWTSQALFTSGITLVYWSLFNLLPGYPMDGGRVLRCLLSDPRMDARYPATIAMWIGNVIMGLVVLAALLKRNPFGILLAAYLYFLNMRYYTEALAEALATAETALVSEPPYSRSRYSKVKISKIE